MIVPAGPAFRYFGGKWLLAPWIIQQMPAHRIYVEPYGGGASILLRKGRVYAEVYNDLFGEVVGVFRVLRDREKAARLEELLRLTPFSRDEFNLAKEPSDDDVEQARRLIARSFMGYGADSVTQGSSAFRPDSKKSGSTPSRDWHRYPDRIRWFTERLQGVVMENLPALEIITDHDSPETLFYLDPPYVHSTRGGVPEVGAKKHNYAYEMSDDDHRALAGRLRSIEGMAMVSGYRCDLYDELYGGWERHDKPTHADGGLDRTESLWLSPNVSMNSPQRRLFA